MLHKAYQILQDYQLAEDAASEAFIRIYKNIHKIGDPADNRSIAFVVTIVKNVALTMLKQEKSRALEEIDEQMESGFNVEEHTIAQISYEDIRRMLDSLGEEMRSVFLLQYSYGMSHKEIGQVLGISENNVTVRLHRARKKLAALLTEGGFVNASQ